MNNNSYVRPLDNGYWVERESLDSNSWSSARCRWLVRRPSGNPEPDSIEDTYVEVECGARITWFSESGSSFSCEAGHHHIAYTEGGAELEYEREMNERNDNRYEEWA